MSDQPAANSAAVGRGDARAVQQGAIRSGARSPAPVVAGGMLLVAVTFGTIAIRRRLTIVRGGAPQLPSTVGGASVRREPDRSLR